MKPLPHELYQAAQVREFDRISIEEYGIPGITLMKRAGQAAFELLHQRWPDAQKVLVLAGTGNNGGDGYVVARLALADGLNVGVIQVGDPERIQGDALQARTEYLAAGGRVDTYKNGPLPDCDLIVDALFGTGLERAVRQHWRSVIEAVNASVRPVLAIDIPSGLHSDTGRVLGAAIRAACTISFIGLKQGMITGQAADYCGDIHFNHLGVPDEVYSRQVPSSLRITRDLYRDHLRPRARDSHKGHFGHVLIVGGDLGMPGAARLAAEAAARSGAGLVSVATRESHAPFLAVACPVLMVHGVETVEALERLIERSSIIAIGPGLGQGEWGAMVLQSVLSSDRPLIMDADALNLISHRSLRRENWILTPHPGEAARLLGVDNQHIQTNRFTVAATMQERYGGVVVLKGHGTLIRSKQRTAVCEHGNPGMASGGMGDVLTGVIAALAAQKLDLITASELGVCLHAAAADQAAVDGERGLLATDLFINLHRLLNPWTI